MHTARDAKRRVRNRYSPHRRVLIHRRRGTLQLMRAMALTVGAEDQSIRVGSGQISSSSVGKRRHTIMERCIIESINILLLVGLDSKTKKVACRRGLGLLLGHKCQPSEVRDPIDKEAGLCSCAGGASAHARATTQSDFSVDV
jgi:hypothetical protein